MTASSIGAAKGRGYARYLESKTVEPERGDYYLSPEGEPTQAPGRWLASAETLQRLGVPGTTVDGPDFVALMEGRHPRSGGWLRAAGADGARGGGIDITFSAPKSVSASVGRWEVMLSVARWRLPIKRLSTQRWRTYRDGANSSPPTRCWDRRGAGEGSDRS